MIKATIIGGDRVSVGLEKLPANITQSVAARVQKVLYFVEGNVKSKKLSGQVLHVRTNRLRSSIHSSSVEITTDKISGAVGTNVVYAHPHEYGFTGVQNVREHLRMIKQAFGHQLTQPVQVTVHQHSRHVHLPERSFLRSQLREDTKTIQKEISLGVAEGAKLG